MVAVAVAELAGSVDDEAPDSGAGLAATAAAACALTSNCVGRRLDWAAALLKSVIQLSISSVLSARRYSVTCGVTIVKECGSLNSSDAAIALVVPPRRTLQSCFKKEKQKNQEIEKRLASSIKSHHGGK